MSPSLVGDTELRGGLAEGVEEIVPVLFGGFPSGAETQHPVTFAGSEAHGGEDMGRLLASARAGAAGGHGASELVELDDPSAAAVGGAGHEGGHGVPEAWDAFADDPRPGQDCLELFDELVAPCEARLDGGGCGRIRGGEGSGAFAEGGDHGEDSVDVLGTAAPALLLGAAHQEWGKSGRTFEEADTLGATELVGAADDHGAASEGGGGKFADPLRGIAGIGNAVGKAERGEIGPGLEDAGLIVGGHDEDGGDVAVAELVVDPGEIDDAVRGDRNQAGAVPEPAAGGGEDGGMFDGGDEDGSGGVPAEVLDDGVVGFGGTGGPDDFRGLGSEEMGDLFPGFVEGIGNAGAPAVGAGGIGGESFDGVQPCGAGDSRQRMCGVVVEIAHGLIVAEGEFRTKSVFLLRSDGNIR